MQKNKKNDVTIIINSCDKYSDLWYPFFELFRIQWPDCPFPIILNTESKTYTHPQQVGAGITCLQLFKDKPAASWSNRLLETLKFVDTEFVIMMLEDDFIHEKVSNQEIDQTIAILRKNKRIIDIVFSPMFAKNDPRFDSHRYNRLKSIKRIKTCQYSADCAIWRTSKLLQVLKDGESINEFELNTKRRRKLFDKVYMFKEDAAPICIKKRINLGYGVSAGKWLFNNKELFDRYGIPVDFSQREIFTEEEINEKMTAYRAQVKQEKSASLFTKWKNKYLAYKDAMPEGLHNFLSNMKRKIKK